MQKKKDPCHVGFSEGQRKKTCGALKNRGKAVQKYAKQIVI